MKGYDPSSSGAWMAERDMPSMVRSERQGRDAAIDTTKRSLLCIAVMISELIVGGEHRNRMKTYSGVISSRPQLLMDSFQRDWRFRKEGIIQGFKEPAMCKLNSSIWKHLPRRWVRVFVTQDKSPVADSGIVI